MKLHYLANIRMPTERANGAQVMHMCEAFADEGIDVTLILPTRKTHIEGDPYEYYGVKNNFEIVRVTSLDTVRFGRIGYLLQTVTYAMSAMLYSLKNRADVYYSRDEFGLLFVSIFHRNIFFEGHTNIFNIAMRTVLQKAKGIITITEGLKHIYTKKGIVENKIFVAPDAIDLDDFDIELERSEVKEELGLDVEKKTVLYIGRLDTWKGVDTLLEASEMLRQDVYEVALIGGEEKEIEELSKKYPNVRFLGYMPYKDLPKNQQAADVLILPNTGKDEIARYCTSPLKLFSYMAANRPMVASDLPTTREIVDDRTCMFFEPDNPKSLAKAIESLFADPEHAQKIASNAKELVKNYTWEKRAQNILTRLT